MTAPLVSVIIATYNRKQELMRAIKSTLSQSYPKTEIIVVSNSDDGTGNLFTKGSQFDQEFITYLHEDERMGVAKARNIGYQHAEGDILVTIDDDAEFGHESVLNRVVSEFESDDDLGIIAFRIENAYTGDVETIPRRKNDKSPTEAFDACYFIGAGNAIHSAVFRKAGYYPDSFLYGAEELDLSYRALDEGFTIRYVPDAYVRHKESPHGRFNDAVVLQYLIQNRLRFAIRNLPWKYAFTYISIWTIYTLYLSNLNPIPVLRAYSTALSERDDLSKQRDVISDETISYLKQNSGRLLY